MQAIPALLAAIVAVAAQCGSACADDADTDTPATAIPVLDFLGSLGVVAKVDQGYNYRNYVPALWYLGVRNLRDGGSEVQNLITRHKQTGVKVDILDGDDYANPHNYVIGNCHVYVDNMARQAAAPRLNGCWDGTFGEYHLTWMKHYDGPELDELRSLPRVTTETGWDSVSDPGGEDVQGKVLTNTYLDQYAEGWSYTFIYELGNGEGGGGNQGLFHAD